MSADENTPGPGAGSEPPRNDGLGAATRALRDATVALTRLIREEVAVVGPEVYDALNASLHEASRGLDDVTEKLSRKTASSDRRRRVEQTRADLLDAAARVISRRGFEGASVEDIASEAGYTKGALYSNFGSKSGLFIALARRWFDAADPGTASPAGRAHMDGLFAALRDGDAGDDDALTRWLTAAQHDPYLLLPLEFAAFALRHPESRDELGGLLTAALDRVAAQIAALRAGTTGPDAAPATQDDHDTALVVVSVYLTANLLGAATGSPTSSPVAVARVVERLLADRHRPERHDG